MPWVAETLRAGGSTCESADAGTEGLQLTIDFSCIAQEVLQHLAAVDGTTLEVTVEIGADNEAGFPPDKVRVVTENAATLKFDQHGFEGR